MDGCQGEGEPGGRGAWDVLHRVTPLLFPRVPLEAFARDAGRSPGKVGEESLIWLQVVCRGRELGRMGAREKGIEVCNLRKCKLEAACDFAGESVSLVS